MTIGGQGVTIITFRAIDDAGNVEATKTAIVCLDSRRPVSKAVANAVVRRGKVAQLRFRVNDEAIPRVTVTIRIFKAGKLIRTPRLGARATNRRHAHPYLCRLARGRYSWKVCAADLAGNPQASRPPGSLRSGSLSALSTIFPGAFRRRLGALGVPGADIGQRTRHQVSDTTSGIGPRERLGWLS